MINEYQTGGSGEGGLRLGRVLWVEAVALRVAVEGRQVGSLSAQSDSRKAAVQGLFRASRASGFLLRHGPAQARAAWRRCGAPDRAPGAC